MSASVFDETNQAGLTRVELGGTFFSLAHGRVWLLFVSILMLILQIALMIGLAEEVVTAHLSVAIHVVLCCVTAAGSRLVWCSPEQRSGLLALAFWTASVGPFGTLIYIGTTVLRPQQNVTEPDFGAWLDNHAPKLSKGRAQQLLTALLDHRLRVTVAENTLPLFEVFSIGSRDTKFNALSIIRQRFEAGFAPALDAALRDDDASVRVLASTVLAKLQTKFAKNLALLEQTANSRSSDPDAWTALARARLDFAASGLLGVAQSSLEKALASACLRKALALRPRDEATRLQLATLLIDLRDYQTAAIILAYDWSSELASAARDARVLLNSAAGGWPGGGAGIPKEFSENALTHQGAVLHRFLHSEGAA